MSNCQDILSRVRPGDVILTSRKGFDPMSIPIKIGNYFKKGPINYEDRRVPRQTLYANPLQLTTPTTNKTFLTIFHSAG